jgi:F0F1-type ATP synthase assembly protein I
VWDRAPTSSKAGQATAHQDNEREIMELFVVLIIIALICAALSFHPSLGTLLPVSVIVVCLALIINSGAFR